MSMRDRLLTWKELFPIIGPIIGALIVAGTTVLVAIVVTEHLTTATKRAEFFLDFTKRYHNIIAEKHKLDRKIKTVRQDQPQYQPNKLEQADAHQIYFQLFGLIYDEFYAFRHNFLDPEALVHWMTWQMHDAYDFEIGGVSYTNGWEMWFAIPAVKPHQATPFMIEVRKCKDEGCVRRVVMSYAP